MPDKPKTQKETIDQVWFGMYGVNGSVGLVGRMTKLEERLDGNGKKPRRLEIIGGIVVLLVGLQTLGVVDGLRVAIMGWLAGGAG